MQEYDVIIIEPTSTEFNRGSFCYLPYLFYMSLREQGVKVKLLEDFTVAHLDELPKARQYYASCWSYPQLDSCFILNRYIPGIKFFGYYPMIRAYHLPVQVIPDEFILQGMKAYPDRYKELEYLLLSDCDMHLKKYEGQVYPLFTSYGCPMGCAFCPSTVNCNRTRLVLDIPSVRKMILKCAAGGYTNIHFTDEDFFFDAERAYMILLTLAALPEEFQLISLGGSTSVYKFIKEYGTTILKDAGMKLIEIGIETADANLAKSMGKPGNLWIDYLIENCDISIFWLSLTFFPGETIETLNSMGRFLKEHGWQPEDLYGRIATNSTEGGLGQFFQPYHGTKDYIELKGTRSKGMFISDRPVRLLPSYIPSSFYNCTVKIKDERTDYLPWFELYNIKPPKIEEDQTLWESMKKARSARDISYGATATAYAIYARLNMI